MSAPPNPEAIMQLGMGFWASKTFLSAIELEVFTELAKHPEDIDALRVRLGLNERGARDFVDTLVALGMLEREDGVYRNTPNADFFLDKEKPSYIGGMLEMANHRLYGFWGGLTEALRTGLPQNETRHGQDPLFETLYADPARLKEFLAAMTGVSHGANMQIARAFPWGDYSTFVDVGTAQGDLVVQIAEANDHLRGVGFDLPVVEPIFEEYAARSGPSDRINFRGGDFFSDPLPPADVILMGHVLHDWNLDDKRMLIHSARHAPGRRSLRGLRGTDRRRAPRERFRPLDESQHAHRDRRRLRLFRCGLSGLAHRRRVQLDAG